MFQPFCRSVVHRACRDGVSKERWNRAKKGISDPPRRETSAGLQEDLNCPQAALHLRCSHEPWGLGSGWNWKPPIPANKDAAHRRGNLKARQRQNLGCAYVEYVRSKHWWLHDQFLEYTHQQTEVRDMVNAQMIEGHEYVFVSRYNGRNINPESLRKNFKQFDPNLISHGFRNCFKEWGHNNDINQFLVDRYTDHALKGLDVAYRRFDTLEARAEIARRYYAFMTTRVNTASRQQPLLRVVAWCDVGLFDPSYVVLRIQINIGFPFQCWYRLTPPLLPERAGFFC